MNFKSKEQAYSTVLPMYVGSEAQIEHDGRLEFIHGFVGGCAIIFIGQEVDIPCLNIETLHLRSYSSMTDAEAMEFARLENRKLVKVSFARFGADRIGVDGFNEGATQPIYYSFNKLTPAQFSYLLQKGFDVFGLIAKGYAKELEQRA